MFGLRNRAKIPYIREFVSFLFSSIEKVKIIEEDRNSFVRSFTICYWQLLQDDVIVMLLSLFVCAPFRRHIRIWKMSTNDYCWFEVAFIYSLFFHLHRIDQTRKQFHFRSTVLNQIFNDGNQIQCWSSEGTNKQEKFLFFLTPNSKFLRKKKQLFPCLTLRYEDIFGSNGKETWQQLQN